MQPNDETLVRWGAGLLGQESDVDDDMKIMWIDGVCTPFNCIVTDLNFACAVARACEAKVGKYDFWWMVNPEKCMAGKMNVRLHTEPLDRINKPGNEARALLTVLYRAMEAGDE